VALIAVLEATEAPGRSVNGDRRQLVCVANTHVHSNPELTDVKLWQVRLHVTTVSLGCSPGISTSFAPEEQVENSYCRSALDRSIAVPHWALRNPI